VVTLPKDIRKHFKQYNLTPHRWELIGDLSQSHAFLKKIRPDTNGHRRLEALWLEMSGSQIHWTEAYAIHNILQLNGFATKYLSIRSQVTNDPKNFMKDHWKNMEDPQGLRAWTRLQYDDWVSHFPWNNDLLVKIVPAVHGTSEEVAYSIITTGFVALSKLDSGYYGKGIYFTTSVEYALPYFATKSKPTVIICLVISGNAYPVIEHPHYDGSFMGTAMTPGYHSHYVLTRKDGYPCPKILYKEKNQFYDELVIEQEASILPFYLLKISTENLSTLALAFQKEQEALRNSALIDPRTLNFKDLTADMSGKVSPLRKTKLLDEMEEKKDEAELFELKTDDLDTSSSSDTPTQTIK